MKESLAGRTFQSYEIMHVNFSSGGGGGGKGGEGLLGSGKKVGIFL